MSEQEERQKKAFALLDYYESKQELALLVRDANNYAETLEALAKLLREDPTRIDRPDGALPPYKEILDLAHKIKSASSRVGELRSTVIQSGINLD
jgi:hypothetical protein